MVVCKQTRSPLGVGVTQPARSSRALTAQSGPGVCVTTVCAVRRESLVNWSSGFKFSIPYMFGFETSIYTSNVPILFQHNLEDYT